MKIRNGFVSNSSSSSFIVAYKNEEEAETCVTCGKKAIPFRLIREKIQESTNSDTEWRTDDYEELVERIKEWKDEELDKKLQVLKGLGFSFAMFDISYHDNLMNSLVTDHCGVQIVYKD